MRIPSRKWNNTVAQRKQKKTHWLGDIKNTAGLHSESNGETGREKNL